MRRFSWLSLGLLPAALTACGPTIQEMRMASAPPRPDDCELQFLQLKIEDLAPMVGTYEMIGSVSLFETGVQDPFQQKYKDIVRPRACRMGGEGVTILAQSSAMGGPMNASGSAISYSVVRKRPPPGSAPPPPTKF